MSLEALAQSTALWPSPRHSKGKSMVAQRGRGTGLGCSTERGTDLRSMDCFLVAGTGCKVL